jgi:hypothetical protein
VAGRSSDATSSVGPAIAQRTNLGILFPLLTVAGFLVLGFTAILDAVVTSLSREFLHFRGWSIDLIGFFWFTLTTLLVYAIKGSSGQMQARLRGQLLCWSVVGIAMVVCG